MKTKKEHIDKVNEILYKKFPMKKMHSAKFNALIHYIYTECLEANEEGYDSGSNIGLNLPPMGNWQ